MAEIERFGTPTYLFVPNGGHRLDAPAYKKRYPALRVFAPRGLRERVAQVVPVDGAYEDFPQDDVVRCETLHGVGESEGALIVQSPDGVSVVLNDCIFNMDRKRDPLGFLFTTMFGSAPGPRVSRLAKLVFIKNKPALRADFERFAALPQLTRVIVAHEKVASGAEARRVFASSRELLVNRLPARRAAGIVPARDMRTKSLLITLPLIVFGVLVQSAFWVPTYQSQAKGNPARLTTFIRGTLGDPKFLNPIVNSDNVGAIVIDDKVIEGLVAADEHAKLVPRLADHWETTEEAYVAVLPDRKLPDGTPVSAESLLAVLHAAWKGQKTRGLEHVTGMALVPSEERRLSPTVLIENAKGKKEPLDVAVTVTVPERVKLQLSKVDPQLFVELEPLLGVGYFKDYPFADRFRLAKPELRSKIQDQFPDLLGVGEHNPVITFVLRPGIRWHDGVPLTAEDVKFTYEAFIDPKNASPRAASYEPIKSVEVVNELTARMTYKRLYAPAIIDWTLAVVPKHLLDGPALEREMDRRHISQEARKTFTMRNSDFERKPIGTGPYRFVEWLPDQYLHLTRNDDYWRTKSQYRELYFRNIPDYLTMELEFQAGALDWYDVLPHQAERYRQNPDYHLVPSGEGNYAYIAYNERRPPFQDIRVRRALGMAIDVTELIKYVLSGQGRRATGPYYTTTPFNDPTVKPLPYDPKAALALLAEAGWHENAAGMLEKDGKPLQFTLVTNNGNPQRKAVMTVAQEAWRKIGIDCKIQVFEWSVFMEDFVNKNNFDAIVLGWIAADLNPDKFTLWHSSQTHPYELNFGGYQSKEADALIERIRVEYDPDEQVRLTRLLHRRIAEDQPYTFLYELLKPVVLDKRIARVLPGPEGQEKIEKIETIPSSSIDQLIWQWRKLSTVPEYSAE